MRNKQDIVNILLVSLDEKFAKNVAKKLANILDMFFVDCHELIEYDLVDSKTVLKTCGIEYLKKREKKVIENSSEYENTILTIGVTLFKEYTLFFERSVVIYLKRPLKAVTKTVNKIEYENYDEFLTENSDFSIELDNCTAQSGAEKIIEKMRKVL